MAKVASPLRYMDYRLYLKEVISSIKEKNPSFSLRSLALKLETPASYMSEVISGKRNLSLEKAMKFARLLKMTSPELGHFCRLISLDSCTDEEIRNSLLKEIEASLERDPRGKTEARYFEIISSWECIAIFELLKGFPSKPAAFFAQELGIQEETAQSALEKLCHIQAVAPNPEGGYRLLKEDIFVSTPSHNLALKSYNSAMIEKARHAIYNQSPNRRFTGTETLMIDPRLLPEAHKLINQCMDKILLLLNQSEERTTLVHLQVHLFELNNKKEDAS